MFIKKKIYIKAGGTVQTYIHIYRRKLADQLPGIGRAFDGFLAVLPPCPRIRRRSIASGVGVPFET